MDGDPEPEMPNFFARNFNWEGVDEDQDGVIDDVEIWINENIQDPNMRKAYKQYASDILVALENFENTNTVTHVNQMFDSMYCTFYFSDSLLTRSQHTRMFDDFYAAFFNYFNTDRKKRKLQLDQVFASIHTRSIPTRPKLKNWEYCKFEIVNRDRYEQMIITKYPGSLDQRRK